MSERDDDRGNEPVDTLRDGALKVSIFRNHGENGDYYTLDPSRIYTDEKSGEVREASSLSGSEPLRMANLLTRSYASVGEFREQDKEQAKDARPAKRSRARDDERDR
jgi:hypothetical protein